MGQSDRTRSRTLKRELVVEPTENPCGFNSEETGCRTVNLSLLPTQFPSSGRPRPGVGGHRGRRWDTLVYRGSGYPKNIKVP